MDRQSELREQAALGASIGTLAARFGVPYNTFNKWMLKGKNDFEEDGGDEPYSPYKHLWSIYSQSVGQARLLAEASVVKSNPDKFLTSKTSRLLGEDHVDKGTIEEQENSLVIAGEKILETLKLFRNQGMDLNEIIDSGKLEVSIEAPKNPQLTIELEKLPSKNPSLPGPLAQAADELELLLNPSCKADE